jgi:NAD(P)-dependent dehydrogenase (short-subunit alcohol dehydrogenase family)
VPGAGAKARPAAIRAAATPAGRSKEAATSAGGLARGIVPGLAAEGADVVVTDIDLKKAETLVGEVPSHGRRLLPLLCDVSRKADIDAMVAAAMKELGRIDILINNAAIYPLRPWTEIKEEEWDKVFAVNVKAYFLCARACVPHMLRQQAATPANHCCGKIVNIASITAWGILPNLLDYVSTKGAVISFTRGLAREIGPQNITVNAIAPGAFPTDAEKIHPDPENYNRYILDRQALKRRGTAEDLANAVVFLASPRSDFITGHTLVVDGGWVMG